MLKATAHLRSGLSSSHGAGLQDHRCRLGYLYTQGWAEHSEYFSIPTDWCWHTCHGSWPKNNKEEFNWLRLWPVIKVHRLWIHSLVYTKLCFSFKHWRLSGFSCISPGKDHKKCPWKTVSHGNSLEGFSCWRSLPCLALPCLPDRQWTSLPPYISIPGRLHLPQQLSGAAQSCRRVCPQVVATASASLQPGSASSPPSENKSPNTCKDGVSVPKQLSADNRNEMLVHSWGCQASDMLSCH